MTLPKWWLLVVAALIAGAVWSYGRYERGIGARNAVINTLTTHYAQLAKRKQAVDTAYRVDTLRRTSVQHHTDSVLIASGPVIATPIVRERVQQEREACDAVIQTCEQRIALRDSMLANRDSAIRLLTDKHVTIKPRCVVGPNLSTDGRVRLGVACGVGF